MTKKNPDDSVQNEQSGANENALGTEKTTQAENAQEIDSLENAEKAEEKTDELIENEEIKPEKKPEIISETEEPRHEDLHAFDDVELPEVDYSGYSKHDLVETLGPHY